MRNRGRYEMGVDILGISLPDINLNPAINTGLQQAGQDIWGNITGAVASNPQVQAQIQTTAQKTAASKLADWLLANKTMLLVGIGVVGALVIIRRK